jgi:two-component system, response regulator
MIRPLLIVEDNSQDEFFILEALNGLEIGVGIEVVRDGEEALRRLLPVWPSERRSLPCAVVLDIMLPRVNGLEVLRRLREDSRTEFLPVIMFSSSGERKDLLACYEGRANAYVQKSSDIQGFQRKIRSLAAFWARDNTPLS